MSRVALALLAAGLLAALFAQSAGPVPAQGLATAPTLVGSVDQPAISSSAIGSTSVQGWAIDTSSPGDSGVSRVSVYVDGDYVADAQTGLARDDIAQAYGDQFRDSGWQALLDLHTLSAHGPHRLDVYVTSAVSGSQVVVLARDFSISQGFGVTAHLLWTDAGTAARELDQIQANGLDTVRVDVAWDALQPTSGNQWDASQLDQLDNALNLASARGLHVILVVLGTPAWARGNAGSRMTPPSDPSTFANALGFLANRYAQRPDMVYEVWNEPNQSQFWDAPGGPDPAAYKRLLGAAYAAIKNAAPGATVLGGSIAFDDPSYLQGMYTAGAGGQFDGLALHPYSQGHAPDDTSDPYHSFVLALDQARQVMSANGEPNKPIWITEVGWSTNFISDASRAQYFQRAVQIVRARPYITVLSVYGLSQIDDYPDTGLIQPDGTPTQSWTAYGAAVRGQ